MKPGGDESVNTSASNSFGVVPSSSFQQVFMEYGGGSVMSWVYQVLSFFIAFGPLILGTILWHLIWNDDSDSSSNPPPNGPRRRPVPPSPRYGGDRSPRRPQRSRTPSFPAPRRVE